MSFSLDLTDEQAALRDKAHGFARDVIRPVTAEYDRAQEFPWPVLEEAARAGFYGWEVYAQRRLRASRATSRSRRRSRRCSRRGLRAWRSRSSSCWNAARSKARSSTPRLFVRSASPVGLSSTRGWRGWCARS